MTLAKMHQRLMIEASRPMFQTHDDPVTPREDDTVPVIPMSRWVISSDTGRLTKTYQFKTLLEKVRFVTELMEYEAETQHSPTLNITESEVRVEYITHDVNSVTEIDK